MRSRISKLIFHGMIAGFSLAVWSTGVMYAANISSPFNAYLLGFSFPPILSALIIILGSTVFRSNTQENISQSESAQQIEFGGWNKSNSIGASLMDVRSRIRSHHSSFTEKLGTSSFFLGLFILLMATTIIKNENNQKQALAGDAIAFFSAFFGIIFQTIFVHYSTKQLFKIVEFLFFMYFFAAVFLTLASMLFFDSSPYKVMSLFGWVYYAQNPIV